MLVVVLREDVCQRRRYGDWALVTGAAQGIGEGWAKALAREGINVVMVDVQEEKLRQVARRIEAACAGVETRCIVADLSREQAARETHTHVGLLVNNVVCCGVEHLRGSMPIRMTSSTMSTS